MPLFIDSGASSQTVRRDSAPLPVLTRVPDPGHAIGHGALLACAQGVEGLPDGQQAARAALRALDDSFHAAPETWDTQQVLVESLRAANESVRAEGERGRAAAVAALVLRGHRWLIAHVGHVRVWLYREHRLRQLTRDHLVPRAKKAALVERACGLQATIEPELTTGELREGDMFVVTTASVHNALEGAHMMAILQSDHTAQQMAELFVAQARQSGSVEPMSACIARIEKLGAASSIADDSAPTLPVIAPPKAGESVDGFVIERRIHKSRHYVLYRARDDRDAGQKVVLKFPQPGKSDEAELARRFLHEEWVIRRVQSPYFVRLRPLGYGRRTALYSVMEYEGGENLAKRIKRKSGLPLADTLTIARQLLDALDTLHRRGIVHRDVRPSSLLYDKRAQKLVLLGLGGSQVESMEPATPATSGGGLSYTAPEVLKGASATERSDVFSVGATLYRTITAHYPYGRITGTDAWPTHEYRPLWKHKMEIPDALETAIRRACAVDPEERYANVREFAAALEQSSPDRPAEIAAEPVRRNVLPWHWVLIAALLAGLLFYLTLALT